MQATRWEQDFARAQATRCVNVVCMKWGTRYGPEWVNRLYGMVRRNSPIHQVPPATRPMGPLVLSVGALESAEFQRQQADYAAAWSRSQAAARIVPAPGANHFSIVEQFADPSTALFRATRDLVLLGR